MFEELLELYKAKAEEIESKRKEAQAMITLVSAIEKIYTELGSKQNDVELLGRLIDQVDRLSDSHQRGTSGSSPGGERRRSQGPGQPCPHAHRHNRRKAWKVHYQRACGHARLEQDHCHKRDEACT